MAHATSRGQSSTSWSRNGLALLADPRCDVLQMFLLAQGRLHATPLFAGGKTHPRAARNGHLRREGAAETTSLVPGPAKRVLAKDVHLRETASPIDGDGPRTFYRGGGQDLLRFCDREF